MAQKNSIATERETIHDERTALVKKMVAKASQEQDAKTARLRALRLAKEADEGGARLKVRKKP